MDNTEFVAKLKSISACAEALKWIGARDAASAWAECPRGDWLLWLAARSSVPHRQIVLAACACARLSLKHVLEGELRPLQAIELAEKFGRGAAISQKDLRAAAYAAASAANAAADAAAAAAASATYAAAASAAAAAYAANAAADAAANATYAAYAAYAAATNAAAARKQMQLDCANAVRQFIPICPFIASAT